MLFVQSESVSQLIESESIEGSIEFTPEVTPQTSI